MNADIKWGEGKLLVRRSHTHRDEVMDATKTGRDQVITLDARQTDVLRWHLDRIEADNVRREKRSPEIAEAIRASDLLFAAAPTKWNHGGGFRLPSCLDKVAEILELGYKVTPRAMRRPYQRLAREAEVSDILTRSISGHATPEMQPHYSTVSGDEMRAGLAKVIDIATGREVKAAWPSTGRLRREPFRDSRTEMAADLQARQNGGPSDTPRSSESRTPLSCRATCLWLDRSWSAGNRRPCRARSILHRP